MDGDTVAAHRAACIVSSTIALARGLGLGFVAEGVETATSLALLTELGCETVQGYYVCRPVPAPQLTDWLRARSDTCQTPRPPAVPSMAS
jgi:EAL domain-containing protein (putative c-di-GMP-specific phosphodiesterase class I)